MPKKVKTLRDKGKGEVSNPPPKLNPPNSLATITDIRREMARVYRFVFDRHIYPEDATKLIFVLDKMVQAFRHEAELAQLQNSYQDAWSGVTITAPNGAGEKLAAPAQEILPPVKQSEEIEV